MPRKTSPFTQADLARAIRAMKQAFGTASVIFETDGRIRVTAEGAPEKPIAAASTWDDVIDFGPSIPEPTRKLTEGDLKQLQTAFPHRGREWIQRIPEQRFHRRESSVLEQLERYGVGVPTRLNALRQCGPETAEKLYIRGYVELGYGKGEPPQIETLALTIAGAQSLKPPARKSGSGRAGLSAKRRPVDL